VLTYTYLNSFYQTGINNPIDKAVIEFKKQDVHASALKYKKVDEIPFDFVRKKISVVVEFRKKRELITKGAPEEIIKVCSKYLKNGKEYSLKTAKQKEAIFKQYHALSKEGYRVLALAIKQIPRESKQYEKQDEKEMILVGYVAFFDPPKHDVKTAIHEMKQAGIEVKIITGDNEFVTEKICRDLGLEVKGILLGNELASLSHDALKVRVEQTTIFARFSPNDKNRVIRALQGNGHTVGFLGDGINDAPSLKTADVGITVNTAVDIAKESADIVLTHKSLKVLHDGVMEGRRAFGNTMKYLMMGLGSNFGNMFSVAGAVFLLPFLPMLPVQILLNNLLYDVSQMTIPSDTVDETFTLKPKKWNIDFIKKNMLSFGPVSSVYDFLTFFLLFFVFAVPEGMFQTGWFLESLATQTFAIHVIRTKKSPFWKSKPSIYLLATTFLCVIIGWALPYTSLGAYFGLVPLPLYILVVIIGVVLLYLVSLEFAKRIFYKKYEF
jgi:Mg2+-importing ATPase